MADHLAHPDRSRLKKVLDLIEADDKILIREDYGGTYSSAISLIDEELAKKKHKAMVGFAIYTIQDTDHAIENGRLSFGFGSRNRRDPDASEAVGRKVFERLKAAGFDVEWDGAYDGVVAILNLPKTSLPRTEIEQD